MGRGRAPCCEKVGLNKGSWTPEEDTRLIAYIHKYGHGNWRALPKQAGLLRCGKSCRLRWINYLRPDIKRGNFTRAEEETIIKLHGLLGNKWSKIASCLPGRTDNEIKNVWNTHLKKRVAPKAQTSPPPPPADKPEDPPSSPCSTSSVSCSDQGEGSAQDEPKDPNTESDERIDIPIEPESDLWGMLEDSLSTPPQKADTEDVDMGGGEHLDPSKVSPSSSSSDSSATACDYNMDLLGEMPDIPIEPELWGAIEDVPGLFSSEAGAVEESGVHRNPAAACLEGESDGGGGGESQGWLAELEKELDLWGASEEAQQQVVGPWVEMEMEGDPVSSYFQTRPSSPPWPVELLDLDPIS